MIKHASLFCLLLVSHFVLQAQKIYSVTSSDGTIIFNLLPKDQKLFYTITYKNKKVVEASPLGLEFDNPGWNGPFHAGKAAIRDSSEDYELVVGKTKKVHDHYREMIVPFIQDQAPFLQFQIIVRLFKNGVAFRYSLPDQPAWHSFSLLKENTAFHLTGDPVVHSLLLPSFTTSHEGYYSSFNLSQLKEDTLMDMPTLFEYPGTMYIAITEAALLNYPGMYLVKHDGNITTSLSPLPGQRIVKAKGSFPFQTPWRVVMISNRIEDLIESNMITSLSPPCRINDVSWIKPGKTTFPWWNGDITPDTSFAPGNNFETNKYYIDFCARNNIAYHSVVEYGGHEWYMNDGDGFAPGPHADVTTPVPTLHMPEICNYARQKGVGIRIWVYWSALYPKLDSAFTLYEKWGIKGLMVDFMDRDDQQMVQIQEEILQKAALHHLHIQFHGAYKPTGLSRTYPNEFTREGTLNYEADKWNGKGITPDHDIMMPFTRVLAGSTDYHLGGFRAVPPDAFKVQYTRPLVLGTRCHMLAMYVVLENYLAMVCDYPAAYEGQPGFDFIKEVPTVWDETKVLKAEVGKYIVIARRKENDWYIGAITNHETRALEIPLNFLDRADYTVVSYTDAPNTSTDPNNLVIEKSTKHQNDVLKLNLAQGGGAAIQLIKLN